MVKLKGCGAAVVAVILAGCAGGGDTGVRRVGDMTVIEDVSGPLLILDANGCQSVAPPGGGPAQPVRDASGTPVCTGPQT